MIVIYLCAGAVIALIFATYSQDETERPASSSLPGINPKFEKEHRALNRKRLTIAFVLTTLFWPIVILLAIDNASFSPRSNLKLSSQDLLHPIDLSEKTVNSVIKDKQRIHLQQNPKDNLWAFRTHVTKKRQRTMIVEGYALVNNQNDILDYVVVEEYPEELQALH